jgi:Holliday junction DNA helicase RuvA
LDKGLVLETGGIGYGVSSTAAVPLGATITLYTHLVIRDDAHELYGFISPEEKTMFTILIGVSGVGPKTALAVLSLYPLPDLVRIIKQGDSKAVSLVPGLGKKTAEKVIIDLKDKLDGFDTAGATTGSDLVEALLSLGYKDIQIRTIIGTIDSTIPIEKQITAALQLLQK